jgi:hypothetical protein
VDLKLAILMEEERLKVLQNKVLMNILGPKRHKLKGE